MAGQQVGRLRVRIEVALKDGVTDSTGETTARTLRLLGIGDVRTVRTATVYELDVDSADADQALALAQQACDRLLANPVIHRAQVSVVQPRRSRER